MSLDSIFNENNDSPHRYILSSISYKMRLNVNQSNVVVLHLDKINIQLRHLFLSKSSMFETLRNDPGNLAKSMQVFFLSTLTGEKTSVNLCSKP